VHINVQTNVAASQITKVREVMV